MVYAMNKRVFWVLASYKAQKPGQSMNRLLRRFLKNLLDRALTFKTIEVQL